MNKILMKNLSFTMHVQNKTDVTQQSVIAEELKLQKGNIRAFNVCIE